jgi:molecular chaperone GrpE
MSEEELEEMKEKGETSNIFEQKEINLNDLDKELGELKDESDKDDVVVKLTEENAQLKDKFLRMAAELENVRRIATEEKEKISKYAISSFAGSLIPVMEDFFLAFKNAKKKEIEKTFFDGMNLTFNELKKVFEKYGLKRICPNGEKFNPDIHQAITQVESEMEENTIMEVAQAGYVLNDRVLKPALVVVSKKINK